MEAVKCKSLSFTYPKTEYPALKEVSFSLEKGELCIVMGKSAAGKSTLLKLLKKEIAPFGKIEGEIEVIGKAGYVAQNVEESLVCHKVRAELAFSLANEGWEEDEIELAVAQTASYFNLESKLDYDIAVLSDGEKQLLNLAAVMINNPEILILDEPTSRLDPVSAARFVDIIKKMHREFSTTIIDVKGGFTGHSKKVIMCIVPTTEYTNLKNGVLSIDSGAVILITDAYESLNI